MPTGDIMDEIICDHPADCYGSIIWNITYTGQTKIQELQGKLETRKMVEPAIVENTKDIKNI